MKKNYLKPRTEALVMETEGALLKNSFIDIGGNTDKPFDSPERDEKDYWDTSWENEE